jgi:23S rRNA pseudouridine1911/1915/1917 synthase
MEGNIIQVGEQDEGMRLDQWLAIRLPETSRSQAQKWIKNSAVEIANAEGVALPARAALLLKANYTIKVAPPPEDEIRIQPEKIDFPVLYEDTCLAVIHKPPGLAVHPGPGDSSRTIAAGLLYRWQSLPESAINRPGIVHRLDKPTEGLLIVAKTSLALRKLASQFKNRQVEKKYIAWLSGTLPAGRGLIDLPVGRKRGDDIRMCVRSDGRPARTHYKIVKTISGRNGRKFTMVEIQLETGRTHQIRVHFSHMRCPVVGDDLYSRSARLFQRYGLQLLAAGISFQHPESGQLLEFQLELPERMQEFERNATTF